MMNVLRSAGLFAALFTLPTVATAATVTIGPGGFDDGFATSITYESDNNAARRGVSNNRDNAMNALGENDGAFFEVGFGSTTDFTFGRDFDTSISIFEVTFGSAAGFPESLDVYVGAGGNFQFAGGITNAAASGNSGGALSLAGLTGNVFDTVRFIDTSPLSSSGERDRDGALGGFDVDAVRVAAISPVPVPAAGLMLLTALAGAAGLRRHKSKA